eukprot:6057373-Amphidinium_carterae.1
MEFRKQQNDSGAATANNRRCFGFGCMRAIGVVVLEDGAITLVNCDALNAYYINYIVVNCSNAELAASSAACEETTV